MDVHRSSPQSRSVPRRAPLASALLLALAAAPLGIANAADAPADATTLDAVHVRADAEKKDGYTVRQTTSATRLGLSLRETPQSVTVITRQRLDDMGLYALTDVMAQVTGVFVQYTDSERVSINARGYAIANVQVDGMLNAGGYVKANGDSAVYERIEVVRGSTGLTTGAGDPSGSINLVRKRAQDTFSFSSAMTLGSWDNRRLEADIGGPIAFDGRLRARVVAAKQQSDSWRDFYSLDKDVLFATVEADLGPDTLLVAGYDYQSPQTSGATWGTVPYWNADGSLAKLPRSTNLSARWSAWPRVEKQAFARLEQRFGDGWTAKLALARNRSDTDGKMFYGGNGYPRADGSGITVWTSHFLGHQDSTAWEFNVGGPFALWGREHELMAGYSTLEQSEHSPYKVYAAPAGYASLTDYQVIPDWRSWDGNVPQFDSTVYDFDSTVTRIKQKAAFFATRLRASERLSAVLGARYSSWQTDTVQRDADGAPSDRYGYRIDDVLTPYAGLLFDLGDTLTAYASYTDIFKAQDYRDKDGRYLDPIEGVSYEAGLKGEFFDGGLNASAAVFRSEQDNVAEIDDSVPPTIVDGSEEYAYRSTGKGNKVQGYELELQGRIGERWNIAGGYTHLSARKADGSQLNLTQPDDLLRLTSYYRFGGRWSPLSIGGGITWQGEIGGTAQRPTGAYAANGTPITATAALHQGGVTLVNLSAGWRFSDNLSASLTVNNLFDKAYYSRMGFYNGVYWGEPRNLMFNLRYRL
jgi:outer-membrane receptor for ferric coprogen and ferric-rhodotorulic acid